MTARVTGLGVFDRRDLRAAAGVYLLSTLVFVAFLRPEARTQHTAFNHFALLAEAWLDGRLDLGGPPPAYAGNNDFAWFEGRTYVVFPPLPALLLVPWVAVLGGADAVPDALLFALLAGLAPAFLLLALEKLGRLGRSQLSLREHTALAACFALGSVYFFSAVEGTVWFAAHVVGTTLVAAYVLSAVGGQRALAVGRVARARLPCARAGDLRRVVVRSGAFAGQDAESSRVPPEAAARVPACTPRARDRGRARALSLPLLVAVLLVFVHNQLRFGDPFEFGYRYLRITWHDRIERWGLFDYHYLAKNLGVVLTSLPFIPGSNGAPFQINHHGLALWITTPLYLALIGTRCLRREPGLTLAALAVALPSLFYQNTGWVQFGYRFSNDYAVLLFALLVGAGFRLRGGWALLAALALVVNAFGAWTFGRSEYQRFYFTDPTQRILFQPD